MTELTDKQQALLDELLKDFKGDARDLFGEGGLLKTIGKRAIEAALEGEMTHHLGYPVHDPSGRGSGNSRNRRSTKRLESESGSLDLEVPRDRNGSFEPRIVEKRQRRVAGLDDVIVYFYAQGQSTRAIQDTLQRLYGAERRGRSGGARRFRRKVEREVPGYRSALEEGLGASGAFFRLCAGDPQGGLHHQCDRIAELQPAPNRQGRGAFPNDDAVASCSCAKRRRNGSVRYATGRLPSTSSSYSTGTESPLNNNPTYTVKRTRPPDPLSNSRGNYTQCLTKQSLSSQLLCVPYLSGHSPRYILRRTQTRRKKNISLQICPN